MENIGSAAPTVASQTSGADASPDRRGDKRHRAVLRVGKLLSEGHEELCLIRNISSGGLMARVYSTLAINQRIAIEIKNGHMLTGAIAWVDTLTAGVRFDEKVDVLSFLANEQADLIAGRVPRSPRLQTQVGALVRRGAHYVHAELTDISQGGARVSEGDAFDMDDDVVMTVAGLPPRPGTIRWRREGHAGIGFNEPVPFDALARWAARKDRFAG